MGRSTYSDEALRDAVRDSFSLAGALRLLGRSPTGANYPTMARRIRKLGLPTTHWTGMGHSRGSSGQGKVRRELGEILVPQSSYSTNHLKKRLLKTGLLQYTCSFCGLSNWRGIPISLQLDHINGIPDDHRLENLRLLCPNCHSQTETFTGRKLKKAPDPCPDCGGPKGRTSLRCHPCALETFITPTGLAIPRG